MGPTTFRPDAEPGRRRRGDERAAAAGDKALGRVTSPIGGAAAGPARDPGSRQLCWVATSRGRTVAPTPVVLTSAQIAGGWAQSTTTLRASMSIMSASSRLVVRSPWSMTNGGNARGRGSGPACAPRISGSAASTSSCVSIGISLNLCGPSDSSHTDFRLPDAQCGVFPVGVVTSMIRTHSDGCRSRNRAIIGTSGSIRKSALTATSTPRAQFTDFGDRGLGLRSTSARMRRAAISNRHPAVVSSHLPPGAVEQDCAHPVLQGADRLIQRRL